jgi:hypothetical protein
VEPSLDLIAVGRSSVDLYGEQVGGRLEDMGWEAPACAFLAGEIDHAEATRRIEASLAALASAWDAAKDPLRVGARSHPAAE